MIRRALDIAAGISLLLCGVAASCWLAAGTGWKPEPSVSLADIQDHVPSQSLWGLSLNPGRGALGESGVRLAQFSPLAVPVEGPPQEFRGELFPFTSWVVSLTRSSDEYGFSFTRMPIFDPSRPRLDRTVYAQAKKPRLVGMYEQRGIPFWFILLVTAILPAARTAFAFVKNHRRFTASSAAWAITAAAFALFVVAAKDTGWSAEFEIVASLVLATVGLLAALVALRKRHRLPTALSAAYWITLLLVHFFH